MTQSQMVCRVCGGSNVARRASVQWDVASQAWSVVSLYADADCRDCNDETRILEVEAMPDRTEEQPDVNPVRGAMDALREAAKMCRLNAAGGHAHMCDQHADSIEGILPEPGMRFFTVSGYLVNYDDQLPDDDDTTLVVQARDRAHAVAQFAERLGSVWTRRECVVHAVFASATAPTLCLPPPAVDLYPKAPF